MRSPGSQTLLIFTLSVCLLGNVAVAHPADDGVGAKRKPRYTEEGVTGCLLCHFGESMQAIGSSPHGQSDNPLTPYGAQGCESCHGPGSFHVSRAHGGKGFPELIIFGAGPDASVRPDQLEACLACHGRGGGFSTIGFRGSGHDVSSVNCSSCHAMHTEGDPISSGAKQVDICFQCHGDQRTGHPRFGRKTGDFAPKSCSRCHDIHPANNDDQPR